MSQAVIVRFAPSPTGWLHVGNVRTALINFLFAKAAGGKFMLRIDDTDLERSKAEYEDGLKEDLQWLGLQWDTLEKQSDRFDRYELARKKLIEDGRLYPCYDTSEELEVKRKMLIGRGLPPIYDRSALADADEKRKAYEAEGRKPHWRFKLDHAPIHWDDMIRGPVTFDGAKLSDPVLFREDGGVLFTMSTSVDDGELNITHIIRGEDHVSNSAIQIQIMEALGHRVPVMGHMALLKMKEGKISKREGGGDIRSLRTAGILPLALVSYLGKIGTSDAIDVAESLEVLGREFEIKKLGRAMANYDPQELARLNQKLLHHLPFAQVQAQLATRNIQVDENFWEQIKPNLLTLDEVLDWSDIIHKPITPKIDDTAFTNDAATLLPSGEWGEGSWDLFVNAVKEKTGRKGKELFMPLRLALTGMEHGPEMKVVFALLGRDRAEKRLKGETA
jgi:glutamyl-tRNA synthetase